MHTGDGEVVHYVNFGGEFMVTVQGIATPRLQNYLEFVRDPIRFFTRVQPLGDVIS